MELPFNTQIEFEGFKYDLNRTYPEPVEEVYDYEYAHALWLPQDSKAIRTVMIGVFSLDEESITPKGHTFRDARKFGAYYTSPQDPFVQIILREMRISLPAVRQIFDIINPLMVEAIGGIVTNLYISNKPIKRIALAQLFDRED